MLFVLQYIIIVHVSNAPKGGSKMRYQEMSFGKKQKRISLIHMNKPMQNGVAGFITSRMFSDKIPIIVDNATEEECDYDFACLACGKNGLVPRIIMSREVYYDIKRGKLYARVILLHELGHYFCKHHLIQNENRDEERTKLASNDEASEEEIKADLFAVEYLGVECVGFSNTVVLYSCVALLTN